MSDPAVPVKIKIMDKDFQVSCPESEKAALLTAVDLLTEKMLEVKKSGKVFGVDRIAIMAALNITHELVQHRQTLEDVGDNFANRVKSMSDKIDAALQEESEAQPSGARLQES